MSTFIHKTIIILRGFTSLIAITLFMSVSFYSQAGVKTETDIALNPDALKKPIPAQPSLPAPQPGKITDSIAQPTPRTAYMRPNAKARFRRYLNSLAGPSSLATKVLGAGYSTATNSPEEWGGQWEGFGRRVASNFGKGAIKTTTIYALDETLKVDSHFYRSKKRDIGSKVFNALISTVTARKPDGKRTIGIPRIIGTYTSNIASRELWYPDRFDWKDGLRSGTTSLGITAAFNLFKEFIWKK